MNSQKSKFDSLIEQLNNLGYAVFIRNKGDKKVIMWSTKTHSASAPFNEKSEDDLKHVCQRLEKTIYNCSHNITNFIGVEVNDDDDEDEEDDE